MASPGPSSLWKTLVFHKCDGPAIGKTIGIKEYRLVYQSARDYVGKTYQSARGKRTKPPVEKRVVKDLMSMKAYQSARELSN